MKPKPGSAPAQLVAVNGRGILSAKKHVATADDLGFTRGDGVFDATRVVTASDGVSRVDNLPEHLARMDRSFFLLTGQHIDRDAWRALVEEAVEAWSHPGEATLKLMQTSGLESTQGIPLLVLSITEITPAALAQRDGIDVVTLSRGMASDACADAPWLLGGVKSLSYGINMAAKREAHRRGADDVLFTSTDGYCLEGPTAALVMAREGVLVTTPVEGTGVLDSITQKQVFKAAAKDGWKTEYRLIKPKELTKADGVWLVSSVRGAAPVLRLDGRELATDKKLTKKIKGYAGFAG
ncbi:MULTISPECIES: aminodeoxychorismate lyase [unclassified Luteococcus]|uniref:aminodeoxychorismate lyase n=1 Tax=unclassified Luteococcus TaxID=2639923 RepID=UPI00313BCC75